MSFSRNFSSKFKNIDTVASFVTGASLFTAAKVAKSAKKFQERQNQDRQNKNQNAASAPKIQTPKIPMNHYPPKPANSIGSIGDKLDSRTHKSSGFSR